MYATEILVGTDGSAGSRAALRWAASEAARHNWAVRVMHVYDAVRPVGESPTARLRARARAEQILADALAIVHQVWPDATVATNAVPGDAAPVLLSASKDAALTVVGSRGRGEIAGLLLGSVSQRVAEHAVSPVVVVHAGVPHEGPIVVGVDDSLAAGEAVGLAFELADARHADLIAVRTYTVRSAAWSTELAPLTQVRTEIEAQHRLAVEQILTPWRDKYPDVHAEVLVVGSRPGPFLVGSSYAASLLVVGRHGTPWSTDLRLVCHATCPVVVVPEPAAW